MSSRKHRKHGPMAKMHARMQRLEDRCRREHVAIRRETVAAILALLPGNRDSDVPSPPPVEGAFVETGEY